MADQLTETEAHLAKLKMAKQMVVEDMTQLANKIATSKEMRLDHPSDIALEIEMSDDVGRWRAEFRKLEKKREEIDKLIVQYMDEVKRLKLRNN